MRLDQPPPDTICGSNRKLAAETPVSGGLKTTGPPAGGSEAVKDGPTKFSPSTPTGAVERMNRDPSKGLANSRTPRNSCVTNLESCCRPPIVTILTAIEPPSSLRRVNVIVAGLTLKFTIAIPVSVPAFASRRTARLVNVTGGLDGTLA